MASIVKRRKKFSVVYYYTDVNGNRRQKWETFSTYADAKNRKTQVEYGQMNGTLIVPTAKTLDDLLADYVSIYGVSQWALSTYESRQHLIADYISPIIGSMKLEELTPRVMDQYYQDLQKVKSVSSNYGPGRSEFVSPHTVHEIHKLLRNAFNQAVKWELMARNPVEHATLPKVEHAEREIWTADILFKAIEVCEDDNLKLAMNLAFACSLRIGEMLALTWDCVEISPDSIASGDASIFVNKELQRVNREAMEDLNEKDVVFVFPAVMSRNNTALVLKKPKTETSIRKIYLPKTVAEMLVAKKAEVDELKDMFGCEYHDYNLVFASPNGRPMESQIIIRAFKKLIRDNDFPKVVFHSLRHSSITYKLKLNGGDVKAVQGDSGHAQVKMVTDVYSHILDEDRKKNAQIFEATFYTQKEPEEDTNPETKEETPEAAQPAPAPPKEMSSQEMLARLLADPNMAAVLKQLGQTM